MNEHPSLQAFKGTFVELLATESWMGGRPLHAAGEGKAPFAGTAGAYPCVSARQRLRLHHPGDRQASVRPAPGTDRPTAGAAQSRYRRSSMDYVADEQWPQRSLAARCGPQSAQTSRSSSKGRGPCSVTGAGAEAGAGRHAPGGRKAAAALRVSGGPAGRSTVACRVLWTMAAKLHRAYPLRRARKQIVTSSCDASQV
jgi:hypothetical protein